MEDSGVEPEAIRASFTGIKDYGTYYPEWQHWIMPNADVD
jgi:hypothetical protein